MTVPPEAGLKAEALESSKTAVSGDGVSNPHIRSAMGRAAVYRLLAAGFAGPNGEDSTISEARETFKALGEGSLEEMALALGREVDRLNGSLAEHHGRLFGFGTGGDLSLYETEHVGHEIFRKSRDLADIAGFYRAFGMEVGGGERERADHLSIEAEFLAWLCLKQSVALSEGLVEKAAICRDAEVKFLKDHFLRWVPRLAKKIEESSDGFYQVLARFTGLWLERSMDEKEA